MGGVKGILFFLGLVLVVFALWYWVLGEVFPIEPALYSVTGFMGL